MRDFEEVVGYRVRQSYSVYHDKEHILLLLQVQQLFISTIRSQSNNEEDVAVCELYTCRGLLYILHVAPKSHSRAELC